MTELLSVVDMTPLDEPRTVAVEVEPRRWCYPTTDAPFRRWRGEVAGTIDHVAGGRELVLCTGGGTEQLAVGQAMYLAPGERLRLDGDATVFRVEECSITSE